MSDGNTKDQATFNIDIHRTKGVGTWRSLYRQFIDEMNVASVLEIGAGAPDFLASLNCKRRVAIDAGSRYAKQFSEAGIELVEIDLDRDDLPDLGKFDVIVCSDVFEHLLYPARSLNYLKSSIEPYGVLFSHVPNEYSWRRTLKIMLGKSNGMYFHTHLPEHEDPHLRRFTRIGFEQFLRLEFSENLFLSDLRYRGVAKVLHRMRLPVPYAFQGGPTFASTPSRERCRELESIKSRARD